MSKPDYIVIRPSADLPDGFLPDRLNGRWFDRAEMSIGPDDDGEMVARLGGAVAVPAGRFESREDGAVAEVYEVRP
ncbi:hypothetical protein [Streptosporangium sp. NPDC004631]